jgi:hypothetical protein
VSVALVCSIAPMRLGVQRPYLSRIDMYCPRCESQYRPNVRTCSDCGVDLVVVRPPESPKRIGSFAQWHRMAIRPDAPPSLADLLQHAHGAALTISSRATTFIKVIEPIAFTLVLVAVLSLTLSHHMGFDARLWYLLAVSAIFMWVVWREALALRTVRLDRSNLYVVVGRQEVVVPLAQIRCVRYRRWNPRPIVWIEFRTPVDGMDRIAFFARGDLAAGVPARDVGPRLRQHLGL